MAFLTFDLTLCPPGKMTMPAIRGGGLEGGRTLSGVRNAINVTGGGLVTVSYREIGLGNVNPAAQLYWSRLGGILNSGARSILVPLLTDFIAPGGFSATFGASANTGAGVISIHLAGIRPTDRPLIGGEWFSVLPADGRWRVHVITDVQAAQTYPDGSADYVVAIAPPLRAAQSATNGIGFTRPLCFMQLAPGSQIKSDVEPGWWTVPDVEFVESFGAT